MYENGFNQLELARKRRSAFVLDNMDIVVDGSTLHDSAAVKLPSRKETRAFTMTRTGIP